MESFVRNIIVLLGLLALCTSCTSNKEKPLIENKQELYYGRSGVVKFVTVERDYSLKQFAEVQGVPVSEIARANGLRTDAYLYAGQVVRVPMFSTHLEGEVVFIPDSSDKEPEYVEEVRSLMGEQDDVDLEKSGVSAGSALENDSRMTKGDKGGIADSRAAVNADSKNVTTKSSSSTQTKSGFKYSTPLNSDEFIWPLHGRIVSRYSQVAGKSNEGINIAAPAGTKVLAIAGGEVIYVGREPKVYGNLIVIKHDGGYLSAYAHNEKILVKKGAFVKQGQSIALVGATGSVKSPQLHFSMRKGKKTLNPESDTE